MKNFKYPLAIEGTKEQLEALIPKLGELGYLFQQREDKVRSETYSLLATFYRSELLLTMIRRHLE